MSIDDNVIRTCANRVTFSSSSIMCVCALDTTQRERTWRNHPHDEIYSPSEYIPCRSDTSWDWYVMSSWVLTRQRSLVTALRHACERTVTQWRQRQIDTVMNMDSTYQNINSGVSWFGHRIAYMMNTSPVLVPAKTQNREHSPSDSSAPAFPVCSWCHVIAAEQQKIKTVRFMVNKLSIVHQLDVKTL